MTGNPDGIFSSVLGGGPDRGDSKDLYFHLRTEQAKKQKWLVWRGESETGTSALETNDRLTKTLSTLKPLSVCSTSLVAALIVGFSHQAPQSTSGALEMRRQITRLTTYLCMSAGKIGHMTKTDENDHSLLTLLDE